MKKILFLLSFISLIAITLFSCKKDGNGNSSSGSDSYVSLLTKARWTFLKFEYQKPDGTWIRDPNAANADQFTVGFNTNNTFDEMHVVGTTSTGTWNFSSNNTVLTTTGGQDLGNMAYTVNQLTTSALVITMLNYPQGGAYVNERLTFTR